MEESSSAFSQLPRDPGRWSRRPRNLAIGCLLLAWLAFDHPVFLGQVLFPVDIAAARAPHGVSTIEPRNPLGADAVDLYYPWRSYLGGRLRDGDLPLWDPHRFAGTPAAANSQMAVWYPPNWLFALGNPLLVFTIVAALSRLAFLLLGYWFFRVLRLHPMAAAAGAIVLVFCGFQSAWSVHPTFLASSMWLPLALGGLWLAVHEQPRKGVALGALGLGLSFLGGHAQVALYVWTAAGLWALVLATAAILERRTNGSGWARQAWRTAALIGATFVLGAGLTSLQLLATAEVSEHIVREREPIEAVVAAAYPVRQLAGMFVPDRFGNPVDRNFVGQLNYTETAAYVGIAALVLAAVALWGRPGRRTVGFSTIGVTGLVAAVGSPLYALLYTAVPGMDRTRAIGRFILLVDVALAGLAALGLDRLLRDRRATGLPVLAGAGVVASGLVATALIVDTGGVPDQGYLVTRFVLAGSVLLAATTLAAFLVRAGRPGTTLAVALVILITVDLWVPGFRYLTFQEPGPIYPSVQAIRRLPEEARSRLARTPGPTLPLNAALVYGLYDIHGSDTFILRRTVELLSVVQDQIAAARSFNIIQPFSPMAIGSPIIDLLGVRGVLTAGEAGSGVSVESQNGALAPAFTTTCWRVADHGGSLEALAALTTEELRTVTITEAGPPAPEPSLENCQTTVATILRYEPERVEIAANPAARSILVLTDAWFPGWEASVDGRSVEVLRTHHALRGVILDPGGHRVVFAYRPGWLRPGLIITGLSIALVAILLLRRTKTDQRLGMPR